MATNISHSPAETAALGAAWGNVANAGLIIALTGDLGTGKTQLVKGLARGLSIPARVRSPTFNLVNIYAGGRLVLFHLDLYRLETREQILAAGLAEYFHPPGVTVIEWAERWFGDWRPCRSPPPEWVRPGPVSSASRSELRWVRLRTLGEDEREIIYEDFGT